MHTFNTQVYHIIERDRAHLQNFKLKAPCNYLLCTSIIIIDNFRQRSFCWYKLVHLKLSSFFIAYIC